MLTDPFLHGRKVLLKIEEYNHQAYFVGGCVRDLLLKRPIRDIDIATSASPKLVQQIFEKVIPVGIEHGTVIVRFEHNSYEVTTFRLDGKYTDQRHPDSVEFIDKIDEDLKRRDFTINALAMDKEGFIIDLFHGETDLHNKIIRTVGDGYKRFTEDPLRIVRALRFSSQLGFTIEYETLENMKKVKDKIETISVERITSEFTKLFAGKHVLHGIDYLINTEIYKHLPIMVEYPYIIHHLPDSLEPLHSFGEVIALFHYIEPRVSISNWIKSWKSSNDTNKEAIQLIDALYNYKNNGLNRWLVYQMSVDYYKGFVRLINIIFPNNRLSLRMIRQIHQDLPIHSKRDLALKGGDLIKLFPERRKGPWIYKMLNKIEKEVVLSNLPNTKYELKEWIKCNPPELN